MKDEEYLLIIRWFNGKVSKRTAPSLKRARTLLNEMKENRGRLITWTIRHNGKKIKQGWK